MDNPYSLLDIQYIRSPKFMSFADKVCPTYKVIIHFPFGISNHVFGIDRELFHYDELNNYSTHMNAGIGR